MLVVERPSKFDPLLIGASIAVSGVCLSVTAYDDASMSFDVVAETWERSRLGSLAVGDIVNLERSVLADQRLDGHVVQGHAEGVGECVSLEDGMLTVRIEDNLNKFFVQKGSVALDGVSLTIASLTGDTITVALVPHTMDNTTLGSLKPGDPLNIETDIVGRYLYAFTHEKVTQ